MASATTFSLKAKLYEERQAFGMIDYDNFEGEGFMRQDYRLWTPQVNVLSRHAWFYLLQACKPGSH